MKSNYNISIILVVAYLIQLTCFTSCEGDLLETTPKTSIDEAEAFSTPSKILAQVNNLYSKMQNPNLYGGRFIIFNEQRADEFGQNDGNAATGSAVWNQNVASTSEYINNVWAAAYAAINASNILISKLNNTTVISDSIARLYIGEAKCIRALSYLSLVQTYAKSYNLDKNALGVPLRLIPVTGSGHNDLARSTVDEVYNKIILDLDEAEAALPDFYPTSYLNTSRVHKASVIALKTRVYLNQSNYLKVKEEASKLVPASSPYQYNKGSLVHALEPNLANVFSGSYTGTEAIFSIPFANSNTETPTSQYSLAFNYLGQPIIFLAAAGIVSHSVFSTVEDARAALVSTNSANQKVLKKFSITTAPFRDYVPVIRYAEVMLNYAEAAAQLNDLVTAANLLKAVRNRAHPAYTFPDDEINTQEKLLNTIFTERRIEFLGEGLRLQDLQRKVQTLPSKKGSIGTAPEVPPTANNYIWPIPSGELSTNKLCLPN